MTTPKQGSTSGIEYPPRIQEQHLPILTFASSVHRAGFDREARRRSAGQSYSAVAGMTSPAADHKFFPSSRSTAFSFIFINIVERMV
jgi:hypothetical protein